MDPWKRNPQERLDDAKKNKELGTEKFKVHDYRSAGEYYIKALQDVIPITSDRNDLSPDLLAMKTTCYSNLAACQLHLNQFDRVIINCNKSLSLDANNVKCLYRRASAYLENGYYEISRNDLDKLFTLEPDNSAAKQLEKKLNSCLHDKDSMDASVMKAYMKQH